MRFLPNTPGHGVAVTLWRKLLMSPDWDFLYKFLGVREDTEVTLEILCSTPEKSVNGEKAEVKECQHGRSFPG